MTSISEKAMLSRFRATGWRASKADRSVSDEVAESKKAERTAGKYYKKLIRCVAIDDFNRTVASARAYHNKVTLPWLDSDFRILPNKFHMEHVQQMAKFREECMEHVEHFCQLYELSKNDAKKRLGELFNEQDYPPIEDLKAKFTFTVSYMPIPEVGDWRVEDSLKAETEKMLLEAQNEAVRDLLRRLHSRVEKLHERLSDPTASFRNSLLDKVKGLVEVIPDMNVIDNADVRTFTEEVRKHLCSVHPDDLRNDLVKRQKVSDAVSEILERMKGYV